MWVALEHRGQGVALALLDAVFAWANAQGFHTVVASVTPGNIQALRFYRKYGFTSASNDASDSTPAETVQMKAVERAPA